MRRMQITVGRLLCSTVRDVVSRMRFEGYDITSWESSGWFAHDFVFRGDDKAIQKIDSILHGLKRQLDQVDGGKNGN